jgi:hypothetical protein
LYIHRSSPEARSAGIPSRNRGVPDPHRAHWHTVNVQHDHGALLCDAFYLPSCYLEGLPTSERCGTLELWSAVPDLMLGCGCQRCRSSRGCSSRELERMQILVLQMGSGFAGSCCGKPGLVWLSARDASQVQQRHPTPAASSVVSEAIPAVRILSSAPCSAQLATFPASCGFGCNAAASPFWRCCCLRVARLSAVCSFIVIIQSALLRWQQGRSSSTEASLAKAVPTCACCPGVDFD